MPRSIPPCAPRPPALCDPGGEPPRSLLAMRASEARTCAARFPGSGQRGVAIGAPARAAGSDVRLGLLLGGECDGPGGGVLRAVVLPELYVCQGSAL